MFLCCAFALALWGMAIFFPTDQIMVHGHMIKRDDPGFRRWMIVWRVAMGLGGAFSTLLALMCHKNSRKARR
jgi:hypothetical protein